MTIKSMTGFARADGSYGQTSWQWEVKTVNGRALDIRLRLPPGYELQEKPVRDMVAQRLARGNVFINLQVQRPAGASEARVNEAVLAQMLTAIDRINENVTVAAPSAVEILTMKGVLEWVEVAEEDSENAARIEAMLTSLASALDAVEAARRAEGEHLAQTVWEQLGRIERLVGQIERSPARSVDMVRKRLREGVARLLGECAQGSLDEARLHQEAAMLATRMDVEEELKRLTAHVAAARELLQGSGPVGRRLDFLAQEFNREANTVCSKSNDIQITQNALSLKAVIDQMREQVQNIE